MKRGVLLFWLILMPSVICFSQTRLIWWDLLNTYSHDVNNTLWDKDGTHSNQVGQLTNMFSGNYAPGSANSNEVNLFTGTNCVSIPLWTGLAKGIAIPVTLSYNATGIKVNQMASSVGLGWNLNAGGCIRRIVHGLPDDYYNNDEVGWIQWNMHPSGNTVTVGNEISHYEGTTTYLNHILGNDTPALTHDTESDEYIIDCPYVQGSFVFSNKSTVTIPGIPIPIIRNCTQSNLRIVCQQDINTSEIQSFSVVDETGNRFHFDKMEKYRSYQYSAFINGASNQTTSFFNAVYAFKGEFDREYTTAWFLTKVYTYLGDSILFDYDQEKYIADPSYVDFIRDETQPSLQPPYKRYTSQFLNDSYFLTHPEVADHVVTWRIKTITSPTFRMDFLAWNNRQDLYNYPPENSAPCKRIDKLRIFNRYNSGVNDTVLLRQFDFIYHNESTVTSSNTFPNGDLFPGVNQRLFLDSLVESTNYKTFPPYRFTYIHQSTQSLPIRFSYATDIWGYYNGATGNTTSVPNIYIYPNYSYNDRFWCYSINDENSPTPVILSGANRMPDTTLMKLGTLEKIYYPSGGISSFTYEPHQFNFKGHTIIGGGLRIKSKQVFDGNTKISEESYGYEQGEALGFPVYGYFDPTYTYNEHPSLYWLHSYVRTGINIGNSDGNVGYGKVTVYNPGMGSTEHYFENSQTLSSSPNTLPSTGYYSLQQVSQGVDIVRLYDDSNQPALLLSDLNQTTYPYPYTNKYNVDWFRGRLTQQKSRNENDDLVKELFFLYEERYPGMPGLSDFHPDIDTVFGLRIGFLENTGGTQYPPCAAVSRFARYTGVANLLWKKIIRDYDDNGTAMNDQVVEYKYNKYGQISRIETNNSDGSILVQCNKWVQDYFDVRKNPISIANVTDTKARSILLLADSNVLNKKIEERSMIWRQTDTLVLSGKITSFKAVQNNQQATKYLLDQEFYLQTNLPIPININSSGHYVVSGISVNDNSFIYDTRYKPRLTIDSYDDKLRIASSHVEGDNHTVFIWDDYLDVMNATISNANTNECKYTGFEFGNKYLPSLPNCASIIESSSSNYAFAGKYMLQLNPTCVLYFFTTTITNSDENQGYTASVWVKGDAGLSMSFQLCSGSQVITTKTTGNFNPSTDWHLLTLSYSKNEIAGLSSFYISAAISNNGQSNAFIDEVKIYPNDGIITTWSYDAKSNLLAQSAPSEIYTTSEYDDLGRLILQRDFEGNIINKKEYSSGNPALFTWCDSGNRNGKPEDGETIVFTVNSPGIPGAQYQYRIKDNNTVLVSPTSFTTGSFSYAFTINSLETSHVFNLTVEVIIDGIHYTNSRTIRIYSTN